MEVGILGGEQGTVSGPYFQLLHRILRNATLNVLLSVSGLSKLYFFFPFYYPIHLLIPTLVVVFFFNGMF